MKTRIFFLMITLFTILSSQSHAYGWMPNTFYYQMGQVQSQVNCTRPYAIRRDYYGRPIACARTCQRTNWQQRWVSAGSTISVCNYYGCRMQYFNYGSYVYYYNWINYNVPSYCF